MARLPKNKPGVTVPRATDVEDQGGGWFKLLAGQHQAADSDWEPTDQQVKNSERTGVPLRAPTKTYNPGDVIDSDVDLVAKFGANKFLRVGHRKPLGTTRAEAPRGTPASFPGGQVSSGRQKTSGVGDPDHDEPAATTGPMDEDEVRELDEESEAALEEQEEETRKSQEEFGTDERGRERGRAASDEEHGEGRLAKRGGGGVEDDTDISGMTVAELKQTAADEDVDISGAHKRDEIISKIKKARGKKK